MNKPTRTVAWPHRPTAPVDVVLTAGRAVFVRAPLNGAVHVRLVVGGRPSNATLCYRTPNSTWEAMAAQVLHAEVVCRECRLRALKAGILTNRPSDQKGQP